MNNNPLFPQPNNDATRQDNSYLVDRSRTVIQPLKNEDKGTIPTNPAADLIREKLAKIYEEEPDALAEEKKVEQAPKPRSRHQEFMASLSTSGKSLSEIQTAWHNYYANLPDHEKHQVWQEFYEHNNPRPQPQLQSRPIREMPSRSIPQPQQRPIEPLPRIVQILPDQPSELSRPEPAIQSMRPPSPQRAETREPSAIRKAIRTKVQEQAGKLPTGVRESIRSVLFGLTTGVVVLVIFLFSFFNEVIIAPFIQPARAHATPIIVTGDSVDTTTAKVIIPKINVEIPVVYDLPDGSEDTIQEGLNRGVVQYPSTEKPGEKGNAAFFGHSSNNIFNKGQYKFAFVLLRKLEIGDTYYLTYNGTVYSYEVIDKKVVPPSQVDVLFDVPGQTATSTLITCDPPGTTLNRMVIIGKQVSPDPSGNRDSTVPPNTPADEDSALPGNGPTLWTKFWRSIF